MGGVQLLLLTMLLSPPPAAFDSLSLRFMHGVQLFLLTCCQVRFPLIEASLRSAAAAAECSLEARSSA